MLPLAGTVAASVVAQSGRQYSTVRIETSSPPCFSYVDYTKLIKWEAWLPHESGRYFTQGGGERFFDSEGITIEGGREEKEEKEEKEERRNIYHSSL
jgi:hypothetical protein